MEENKTDKQGHLMELCKEYKHKCSGENLRERERERGRGREREEKRDVKYISKVTMNSTEQTRILCHCYFVDSLC